MASARFGSHDGLWVGATITGQSFTVWSRDDVTMLRPSGEKRAHFRLIRLRSQLLSGSPLWASQRRADPESSPVKTRRPSGLNWVNQTPPGWRMVSDTWRPD